MMANLFSSIKEAELAVDNIDIPNCRWCKYDD